jgi:hypothetical protein
MGRGALAALAAVVLFGAGVAGGCFDRPLPECAFFCGPGGECPDGYGCAADGWCKRQDVDPAFECPNAPVDAAVADAPSADAPEADAPAADAPEADAPEADAPPAPPVLASVDPTGGPLAGGTEITITGTGFEEPGAGTTTVTVGGEPATGVSVESDTEIKATTPQGAAPGPVSIVVTNDNGTDTLPDAFEYFAEPTITNVNPASGEPGIDVTITGSGFVNNDAGLNTVLFGETPSATVIVGDDSEITAVAPAGTGTVDVTVSNQNGSATAENAFTFE